MVCCGASPHERVAVCVFQDDSADLRCQLHFAREELALMCKKLTKLVSESEAAREELSEYRSAYGDVEPAQPPEGKANHGRSREAEVRVHLKLVEEEATLLSRRIVELEMENRGLRAEMSDLRDKMGRCGGEEEEEEGEKTKHTERKREQVQEEGSACREGPVGGEGSVFHRSEEDENQRNLLRGPAGASEEGHQALLALRDHSCILASAIQLLLKPPRNGHSCSPSALASPSEADLNGKAQKSLLPAPLSDALELLQAMLVTFTGRAETLLTGEDSGGADQSQAGVEDLRTSEVKERENPTRQVVFPQRDSVQSCRDPKMRVSLQILWLLHQWFQENGAKPEEKQVNKSLFKEPNREMQPHPLISTQDEDRTVSALRRLLQELGAELQEDRRTPSKAGQGRTAEVRRDKSASRCR